MNTGIMNRLRRGEDGQITTAFVIVGIVMVVALGILAAKLGRATDEKSQVQSAADAAALAGAQQIRKDAPKLILAAVLAKVEDPLFCGLGQNAAMDFANRADARVQYYCYHPSTDTVEAKVVSLANSASGAPAKAQAEAKLGFNLGPCVFPTLPIPPTSPPTIPPPTPGPPPTTTPPPPPDVPGEVHCGDLTIPIVFDGASGVIHALLDVVQIRNLITKDPALKS